MTKPSPALLPLPQQMTTGPAMPKRQRTSATPRAGVLHQHKAVESVLLHRNLIDSSRLLTSERQRVH